MYNHLDRCQHNIRKKLLLLFLLLFLKFQTEFSDKMIEFRQNKTKEEEESLNISRHEEHELTFYHVFFKPC